MSRILIAFATQEGQTLKVANTIARYIAATGNTADVLDSSMENGALCECYDAVIVAASVHAGRHERSAKRFVERHHDFLKQRITAFLSVSLSAATGDEAGFETAGKQAQQFLRETDWRPDYVETIAGAFRYSGFSWFWRWIIRTAERVFKRELQRQNWPTLSADQEFTDWEAVREFVDRFCTRIVKR